MDHSGNKRINLNAGPGVAVREYPTDVEPADYVLFVDGKPVGVIEAKREDEGYKLSFHEIKLRVTLQRN
jgi:type I restriction enzyme R subunit